MKSRSLPFIGSEGEYSPGLSLVSHGYMTISGISWLADTFLHLCLQVHMSKVLPEQVPLSKIALVI